MCSGCVNITCHKKSPHVLGSRKLFTLYRRKWLTLGPMSSSVTVLLTLLCRAKTVQRQGLQLVAEPDIGLQRSRWTHPSALSYPSVHRYDYIHIHIYIYNYMHIYIYTYMCIYIYHCIYICIFISIYIYICIFISIYIYIYTYTYVSSYLHIYIYRHICMCLCT